MAKTTHTPGEWVAKETPNDDDFSFEITAKKNAICTVYRYKEQEADAQLIEAAPGLLAALKEAVFHLQGYILTNGHSPTMAKKIKEFKAAIAKAEGQTINQ